MRLPLRPLLTGLSVVLVALAAPLHEARACGGGTFGPSNQTNTTFVSGHRVAIAMSPAHTVLWDQIEYSGAPAEFAWVMPVRSGATIDVASDAWLEVLDAATSPVITSPDLSCRSSESGGCSCLGAAGADAPGGRGPDTGVTVVHEGAVGPYMTVTISAAMPGAASKWLTDNGYNIPADIQPILDDYAKQGMDFIALRLKPDQGVAQMKPVRVTTPGLSTTFPMRMLQAGTGDKVALKLFVISEARYEPAGFADLVIDGSKLTWDFGKTKDASNYADVRGQALATNNGKTWITAYSKQGALLTTPPDATSGYLVSGQVETNLAQAYFDQALANSEIGTRCAADTLPSVDSTSDKVVELCPPGQPCTMLGSNEIDSRQYECNGIRDLEEALVGLHPGSVVLTRLEAELPRAALLTDLTLAPAADPRSVDNVIKAKQTKGSPPTDCTVVAAAGPMGTSTSGGPPRRRGMVAIAMTLAAAALAVARRSRRQRPALVPVAPATS